MNQQTILMPVGNWHACLCLVIPSCSSWPCGQAGKRECSFPIFYGHKSLPSRVTPSRWSRQCCFRARASRTCGNSACGIPAMRDKEGCHLQSKYLVNEISPVPLTLHHSQISGRSQILNSLIVTVSFHLLALRK